LTALLLYLFTACLFQFAWSDSSIARFTEPPPHSVVTQTFVKIKIAVNQDLKDQVKEVRFFATANIHFELENVIRPVNVPFVLIGKADKTPYEIIWELRNTIDKYFGYGRLYAEVELKNGKVYKIDPDHMVLFSVDRQPNIKDLRILSRHTAADPFKFAVSAVADSFWTIIKQGNNMVRFTSYWDLSFLYFIIDINDRSLVAHFDTSARIDVFRGDTVGYRPLWLGDGIELCFDPNNARPAIRKKNQREVLYSVLGYTEGNNADFYKEKVYKWGHTIRTNLDLRGTLNNIEDTDTGFVLRTAIPWTELGIKPEKDLQMGFDLFNSDFDDFGEKALRYAWSGVSIQNNDNPSEWGTLILFKEERRLLGIITAAVLFIAIVITILLIVIFKKRVLKKRTAIISNLQQQADPVYSDPITKVVEYIESNFGRETRVEDMAKIASQSPAWFSKTFKKETGKAASQYLTEVRIKKACELIRHTRKSLTEICFETGFKEQSHFIKVFKKITGMKPLEFRKKPGPPLQPK
jgi:AraC-like DNA-binding protein